MEAGRFMRHTDKNIKLEPASNALATKLRLKFPVGRMRTGTPPRLDKNTIDYKGLEAQHSDSSIKWFNFENEFNGYSLQNGEISCHMTETNAETHKIIREFSHILPDLGSEQPGHGNGPRYCPSIDKKLLMFPEKARHNIWLEPEGLESNVVYPNGISTGLPLAVQIQFLKTIKGLESVQVL